MRSSAACPNASTISAPGRIGEPGKWSAKTSSVALTFFSVSMLRPGSTATMRSTKTKRTQVPRARREAVASSRAAVRRLVPPRRPPQLTPLAPSVLAEPHRQVDAERLLALEAHVEEVDRLGAQVPDERGVVGHRGLVDAERLDDDLPDAHAYLRAGPDFRGVWLHAPRYLLTRCRRPLR